MSGANVPCRLLQQSENYPCLAAEEKNAPLCLHFIFYGVYLQGRLCYSRFYIVWSFRQFRIQ